MRICFIFWIFYYVSTITHYPFELWKRDMFCMTNLTMTGWIDQYNDPALFMGWIKTTVSYTRLTVCIHWMCSWKIHSCNYFETEVDTGKWSIPNRTLILSWQTSLCVNSSDEPIVCESEKIILFPIHSTENDRVAQPHHSLSFIHSGEQGNW